MRADQPDRGVKRQALRQFVSCRLADATATKAGRAQVHAVFDDVGEGFVGIVNQRVLH